MITLSNILLAVLLLNPLSSVPSTKNFDLNNSLHNYLINNNTSSFLISEKGEIIIDQEFEVQKGYDPKSLMYSNLLLNGLINLSLIHI